MPQMDFERDIADEIVRYFEEHSISFDRSKSEDPEFLAERYFRAKATMISQRPRSVHWSAELRARLSTLGERYRRPLAEIERRLAAGDDLAEFLSKRVLDSEKSDGMLNDFGLHHLHLGHKANPADEHVERSDRLLFAGVGADDVLFVDVRRHPQLGDADDFGWSDPELLDIIHRNWPNILRSHQLQGVSGDTLSDRERKELRRKNVNVVTRVGDMAIAPPGGGTTASGANLKHVWKAMRLCRLAQHTQELIETNWAECRHDLRGAGLEVEDDAEFRLVRLDEEDLTPEVPGVLTSELGRSGWMVLHVASGKHIDWSFESQ